jgi:hypothetical protein
MTDAIGAKQMRPERGEPPRSHSCPLEFPGMLDGEGDRLGFIR